MIEARDQAVTHERRGPFVLTQDLVPCITEGCAWWVAPDVRTCLTCTLADAPAQARYPNLAVSA